MFHGDLQHFDIDISDVHSDLLRDGGKDLKP
jgi:hypothetical protein